MQPKLFALIMTVLILIAVIELIRRQKMSFKYAFAWFILILGVIFFTIFDSWLLKIARWAGFTLLSNFVFFLLLIFVIFFSLLLTIHINEQNNRTETTVQALAKLHYRIKKIEEKDNSQSK